MEKKLLTEERAKERKVANQKFTAKKNRIAKLEGTEAYKYALEQLNKEIQFSKDASLAVKRLDQRNQRQAERNYETKKSCKSGKRYYWKDHKFISENKKRSKCMHFSGSCKSVC